MKNWLFITTLLLDICYKLFAFKASFVASFTKLLICRLLRFEIISLKHCTVIWKHVSSTHPTFFKRKFQNTCLECLYPCACFYSERDGCEHTFLLHLIHWLSSCLQHWVWWMVHHAQMFLAINEIHAQLRRKYSQQRLFEVYFCVCNYWCCHQTPYFHRKNMLNFFSYLF